MEKSHASFDTYLLPVNLIAGQEENDLPALLATAAPRRVERSRAADLLLAMLSFAGGPELSPKQLLEAHERLTTGYYRARGSVTAGMRAAAQALNDFLLERNLANRAEKPVVALLNLAVLRRDTLFVASGGPAQAHLFTPNEVQPFVDPGSGVRGLGLSKNPGLRYYQAVLNPGDLLLFCPSPPDTWTQETLAPGGRVSLELLRRRLLAHSGIELEAALIQFQPGTGLIHRLRPRSMQPGAALPAEPQESPTPSRAVPPTAGSAPAPVTENETSPADSPYPEPAFQEPQPSASGPGIYISGVHPPAPSHSMEELPARSDLSSHPLPAAADPGQAVRQSAARPVSTPISRPARPEPARLSVSSSAEADSQPAVRKDFIAPARRAIARLWRMGRQAGDRMDRGGKSLLSKVTPGSPDRAQNPEVLSPGSLLFLAIAVPIIVVTIAVTVYNFAPGGKSEQRQVYLDQAVEFTDQAAQQTDPTLRRNEYMQALNAINQAEKSYGANDESVALRTRIQGALDLMDGVERVSLRPAIPGGFASSVNITRMAVSAKDAFLLDSNQGRLFRIMQAGQQYDVDTEFRCGPGQAGMLMINPLVDLAVAPPSNSLSALVVAIDRGGNLLYCGNGGLSEAKDLPVPDVGWGEIRAMALNQELLYVLDSANNRVWVYVGTNLIFPDPPRLFFDNEVPTLTDIEDMAIYNDDLYLLHTNGAMTRCTFRASANSQTRCEDPAVYKDNRAGQPGETTQVSETAFSRLKITQPFDPSVYILDSAGQGVYHYSILLNLQRVLLPDINASFPLPENKAVTAMGVSPDLRLFLAFENEVFVGGIP